jgi:hypothetical protein
MQDKKKKNIKVRDLKPKKDAKGGVAMNVSTQNASHGVSHNVSHSVSHGVARPGNSNT